MKGEAEGYDREALPDTAPEGAPRDGWRAQWVA